MNAPTGYLVRERWRTALHVLLLALAGVLLLEVAFHTLAAPNLRVQKVEIHGATPAGNAGLLKDLGLRDREYYFSLEESDLEARLAALPWVASANVSKVFPDRLVLDIRPREALVLSVAGSTVMAVDAEGVVFDVRDTPAAIAKAGWDLPIVSGLTFQTRAAGGRFPDALVPLLGQLRDLKAASPALFRQISELQVDKNDRGSYDVVLYPAHTPVRVRLGDQWNGQVLQQMFVLLDLVAKQGWTSKTKEIDFRATPVVLVPRES